MVSIEQQIMELRLEIQRRVQSPSESVVAQVKMEV